MADKTSKNLQKFRAWVDSLGTNSKVKAALALDCTEQTIRNILAGGKPSGRRSAKIEKVTKKAGDTILAVDWWG